MKKMQGNKKCEMHRLIYMLIGFFCVGMGAVGAVIPVLPSVPFLMVSTFCFGKSSEKLDKWFKNTKIYKKNLETLAKGEGMTWKTKMRIMVTVTLLMGFGFIMMMRKGLYIPCTIMAVVWIAHIIYFSAGVKNYESNSSKKSLKETTV